ncbi:putative bifunctional diguanylate cyclase/phosphodiesterase [Blastococcus sp. SYSU D00813]
MPLWLYLLALVLVPQVGVGVLTAAVVVHQQEEVDGALRAEQAVRALAQLDAARNGVEHEIVPALARTVVDDPAVAASLGVPASAAEAVAEDMRRAVTESRAVTDVATAALPAAVATSEPVVRALEELAVLRAAVDAGDHAIEDVYFDYVDVSNTLARAQDRAATDAASEEVPPATLRATRDVEIVSALAQASARLLPLFLASQLDAGELSAGSRLAGESAWLAYEDAQRRMADLSQPALVAAWERTRSASLMTELDGLLAAQADRTLPRLGVDQLVVLLTQGPERDALLGVLVDDAVTSARSLAAADAEHAQDGVETALQLGVGILVLGCAAAAWVGLRLGRALGGIAEQAGRISEGRLVDVPVAGPREVRTVSAALRSTVASLRRVQDQAAAVAGGHLDDAVLDQPLPGPLGEVVHASVQQIVTSVREREELQRALAHRASHDPLTELLNRAEARTVVTRALHRARRSGDATGLLFVDLDGFKAVNDRHGHACGDDVLRATAARMRSSVRAGDTVFRLGGDEFVVLVERVTDEQELLALAERLITAVSGPIDLAGTQVRVGASVGIAISRDGCTDADALLAEADTAGYRAKAAGRGRAEVFDDGLRRQLAERARLEAEIAAGLAAGEMRLHYQPVVDLADGSVAGFEALVRWERPGIGLVPPDRFVPVAEESALVCELDRWVLCEATRQLAEWRRSAGTDGPGPTVAVNVSGRHLAEPRVVEDVADALAASGLPPHLLVVEVTETVLVSGPAAFEHLAALRRMGVVVAIDDFGTGYTSIRQLRHMPVDTLKIDRSFVAAADHGSVELVSLMVSAAHMSGLTVVAEGVEEPEQLARLRAEGCDHAQGYLLHRPMPADAAGALLGAVPAALPV